MSRWPKELVAAISGVKVRRKVQRVKRRKDEQEWESCTVYLPCRWLRGAKEVEIEFHEDYAVIRPVFSPNE